MGSLCSRTGDAQSTISMPMPAFKSKAAADNENNQDIIVNKLEENQQQEQRQLSEVKKEEEQRIVSQDSESLPEETGHILEISPSDIKKEEEVEDRKEEEVVHEEVI